MSSFVLNFQDYPNLFTVFFTAIERSKRNAAMQPCSFVKPATPFLQLRTERGDAIPERRVFRGHRKTEHRHLV